MAAAPRPSGIGKRVHAEIFKLKRRKKIKAGKKK